MRIVNNNYSVAKSEPIDRKNHQPQLLPIQPPLCTEAICEWRRHTYISLLTFFSIFTLLKSWQLVDRRNSRNSWRSTWVKLNFSCAISWPSTSVLIELASCGEFTEYWPHNALECLRLRAQVGEPNELQTARLRPFLYEAHEEESWCKSTSLLLLPLHSPFHLQVEGRPTVRVSLSESNGD